MRPAGDNGYAAGERTLWILCRALRASCARVLCSVGRPPPRALSSVDRARHDIRSQRSPAPSRARGANVPGAARPSFYVWACINERLSRGFRDHALASHKGDYSGEVSYCSTTLVPHLEEEVGGKCVDFVEVEEERLEDGRSRICKSYASSGHLRKSYRRGKHASRSQDTPIFRQKLDDLVRCTCKRTLPLRRPGILLLHDLRKIIWVALDKVFLLRVCVK